MRSMKACLVFAILLLGCGAVGCVPPGVGGEEEENDPDFRAGQDRKRSGNAVRAIESFERALQRNPRSAAAHFELGLIYYQDVTNYVAAIYHFDRVQRLQPGFSRIDLVRSLIRVCKQELVRDAMGAFTVQMQRELERLERLKQENAELRQELHQLQGQLGARLSQERVRTNLEVGNGGTVAWAAAQPQFVRTNSVEREQVPAALVSPRPGTSYTVRAGDTLYSIARRHGLTASALQLANPGVVPTKLYAGQVIRIPQR